MDNFAKRLASINVYEVAKSIAKLNGWHAEAGLKLINEIDIIK